MDASKKNHTKILFLFVMFSYINYGIYTQVQGLSDSYSKKDSGTNMKLNLAQSLDSLIYYIFSCEFIFLLIKLFAKIFKFIIEITQIYMQKSWELKSIIFNIINLIKYGVKLMIEIVSYYNFITNPLPLILIEILHETSKGWCNSTFLHDGCILLSLERVQDVPQNLSNLQD